MSVKATACASTICGGLLLPSLALACEDGQVLKPGQGCEVTVRWGHDHRVIADFAGGEGKQVVFSHVEGECSVSLFGPAEGKDTLLSPQTGPTRIAEPGEYHLFTRAITVAQTTCRYRVTVD